MNILFAYWVHCNFECFCRLLIDSYFFSQNMISVHLSQMDPDQVRRLDRIDPGSNCWQKLSVNVTLECYIKKDTTDVYIYVRGDTYHFFVSL